jgi:hypothetical protein
MMSMLGIPPPYYNNLAFDIHTNKSEEIMYPKIILLSP